MLDSLARLLYRRRRRVLLATVLLVVVAGAIGGPVASVLSSDNDFDPPGAEAVKAREAIATATGASAGKVSRRGVPLMYSMTIPSRPSGSSKISCVRTMPGCTMLSATSASRLNRARICSSSTSAADSSILILTSRASRASNAR